jgi:hypothetical protein
MRRGIGALLVLAAFGTMGCVTSRQALTPEAGRVRYVEKPVEPGCELLGEVSVGREWFVFDERQPAVSEDDVRVRMRRMAAKMGGNFVVIHENKPPDNTCNGHYGWGRVYSCSADQLESVASL